ncbi:MAG TPA: hypothetical protein VNO50_01955 [Pyrinomonadaceae bacterium]|nr:hypothetical protein [Pyrinomonadaceae bacterium]
MATIQAIQFKVNSNGDGSANIDVRGLLGLDPTEGDVNCDCVVFGDDPIIDNKLFSFNRLTLGNDTGPEFRFNIDKKLSDLNEDRIGADEIYAEVIVSKNIGNGIPPDVLARRKTPTKQVPS